jgi:murein DD-endopeptidase MepM/ murein hydrolase activator NlpD
MLVFEASTSYSQSPAVNSRQRSGFVSPLEIPLFLSGNYGEIRATHFHAGIDIKTQQVVGKKVLAADSGQVFRVSVQSDGYGRSLYLKHANGLVTVYGHLQQFTPQLEKYVRDQQYHKRSFAVNLFPHPGQFVFEKGQVIGYSGNTGSSGGPHLHFEIRDHTASVPLNALKYGLNVRDRTKPRINCIAIYPLGCYSQVNGKSEKLIVQAIPVNGSYMLKTDHISVCGKVGFGVETYDYLDYSSNKCSPYEIALYCEDTLRFLCRLDSISFAQAPYVNSYVDYEEKMRSGRNIQKLYIDPNNKLNVYKVAVNQGVFNFTQPGAYHMKLSVRDAYENESFLNFSVKAIDPEPDGTRSAIDSTIVSRFYYDSLNVFENDVVRVVIPPDALFDDIDFSYASSRGGDEAWSDTFQINTPYVPLLKPYILSLKPYNLTAKYHNKAYIVNLDLENNQVSQAGNYKNGYVTAPVKTFGKFFIAVDTLDPEIRPFWFKKGAHYATGQVMSFKINDLQSGIREYICYIDNKWALFEYDAKNDLITYKVDPDRLVKGNLHNLIIIVIDNKENVSRYKTDFFY